MAATLKVKILGWTAALLAVLASGQTGMIIGQSLIVRDFTTDSDVSATDRSNIPLQVPVLAVVWGSGSATLRSTGDDGNSGAEYAAACIANPFKSTGTGTGSTAFNRGSGTIVRLVYHNISNPNATPGDISLVRACNGQGSGGVILIDNTCTATGCVSIYTTGTAAWEANKYIKMGLSGNGDANVQYPASHTGARFKARISIMLEDRIGE